MANRRQRRAARAIDRGMHRTAPRVVEAVIPWRALLVEHGDETPEERAALAELRECSDEELAAEFGAAFRDELARTG